ncbi:5-oxoprolinase subunit PxpA [Xylophilus sp. GOD-11R]|uniref:LamB/YcsF family protein n=1 Tax=Xylophilus sp. GOD-11R TaxID=3089814 RepID=UPI00298CD449|nr:5-oxoprolinase subunit PxpA [Xylophilus sp. GOD-11R]WPB56276.1 5-oxoprolinase subunit PxpA [Xylophilus sp. GOD-11R]
MNVDLNSDMGESYGAWRMGDDLALLGHVSSANIACGFHAGDPDTMARTAAAAVQRGVAIGAHPSLPDLQGFGRRTMQISESEAYGITLYQAAAMQGFARAAGTTMRHVKAHGALYNMAAKDAKLSGAICRAVRDLDPKLVVFALAGSVMVDVARDMGLPVAQEVFADRSYQDDGSLTPRSHAGAMITDLQQSIAQVRRMLHEGFVRSLTGADVPIRADTICLHGDQPGAAVFAAAMREALVADGIAIRSPGGTA